ncbi:uncharacterized protein I303_102144 [Kwoniella dejecticola CBS 10117]|uniref:Uncharacterized protein n=1 Tax=Kwoniella dejecticola CBS 10117 TaxID=1296121 RepID=A0A1A6ABU3_9TREE|nr:uncharacterized protein I303_01715 [Kwoniella dejecticola CBS 10117]OBR87508.1 hypothetical protein I303_01715 [Kwoniella dejecticola CBS 10117]
MTNNTNQDIELGSVLSQQEPNLAHSPQNGQFSRTMTEQDRTRGSAESRIERCSICNTPNPSVPSRNSSSLSSRITLKLDELCKGSSDMLSTFGTAIRRTMPVGETSKDANTITIETGVWFNSEVTQDQSKGKGKNTVRPDQVPQFRRRDPYLTPDDQQ